MSCFAHHSFKSFLFKPRISVFLLAVANFSFSSFIIWFTLIETSWWTNANFLFPIFISMLAGILINAIACCGRSLDCFIWSRKYPNSRKKKSVSLENSIMKLRHCVLKYPIRNWFFYPKIVQFFVSFFEKVFVW